MPQTGATRYQKFNKSEKGKTKLKAKKDLPKGTNITKTNFKVKKIVIKEQLKKHSETEALSTRKLNVKELLSRLNHFNVNSRTDALDGLRELATTYPEALKQNLGQLIQGVTPLVLNIEKKVRHESLKVLHLILSNVPLEKIEPFFDIMSTFLRSAMTHIDSRIQEDSLLFLDILLLCAPEKMAKDFHKIIPNFLDMISKLRIDSKPGRTLTVNLDSQITSVKWRVKVLHRLKDYLNKFVEFHKIDNNVETIEDKTYFFKEGRNNYVSLFNPVYTSISNIQYSNSTNSNAVLRDEVEKFESYINTLMPLLFETWLEICPSENSGKNMETVVNEDAAVLLKHMLDIIILIWKIIQYLDKKYPGSTVQIQFSQKYRQPFTQHFMNSFPYITNIRSKQMKVFEDTVMDPKLVRENLEICYLYIILNPNVNIKNNIKDINSVLNYIEKTFNQNTEDGICDVVVKILHTVFSKEVTSWTRTFQVMDALFRKIIWAYFNMDLSISFKQNIFSLLCKIALNNKLSHFHSCDAYEMWLKHLPDILLEKSVTIQTIDILLKFAVHSNTSFNKVIKPKLLSIIQNFPTISLSDSVYDTTGYHKLFSLFYWVKCWDDETLTLLEKQLLDNVYKNDYGKYVFDTLRLRIGGIL